MTTESLFTEIEGQVGQWLNNKRIKYDFQSSLVGGRSELGGLTVPFILSDFNLALRIFDEITLDLEVQAKNKIERQQLLNIGFIVVDLHEDDITRNIDTVMERAIQGREMSDLDSDLWFPNMGLYKGIPTIPGESGQWGRFGPQETVTTVAPVVQTDAPTNLEYDI